MLMTNIQHVKYKLSIQIARIRCIIHNEKNKHSFALLMQH